MMLVTLKKKDLFHFLSWLVFLLITPVHLLLIPTTLYAGDPTVMEGSATYNNVDPNNITVTVHQDNTVIDWTSFGVAAGSTLTYLYDAGVQSVLNRDLSGVTSEILGNLNVSGALWILVNTAGIHIGEDAVISADKLILSTLDIQNTDFLAGNYNFLEDPTSGPAQMVNEGRIDIAAGGFGVLMAGAIDNQGWILASLGQIALAAGKAITLDISGNDLISLDITQAVDQDMGLADQIKSTGMLRALGGSILLDARSVDGLFQNVINIHGVDATTYVEVGTDGIVELKASGDILTGGSVSMSGDVLIHADTDHNGTGSFKNPGVILGGGTGALDLTVKASEDSNFGRLQWLSDLTLEESQVGSNPIYSSTHHEIRLGRNFIMNGGTFQQGLNQNLYTYNFTQNGGTYNGEWFVSVFTDFTQTGGVFNAPIGMYIAGNFIKTAGTFNHANRGITIQLMGWGDDPNTLYRVDIGDTILNHVEFGNGHRQIIGTLRMEGNLWWGTADLQNSTIAVGGTVYHPWSASAIHAPLNEGENMLLPGNVVIMPLSDATPPAPVVPDAVVPDPEPPVPDPVVEEPEMEAPQDPEPPQIPVIEDPEEEEVLNPIVTPEPENNNAPVIEEPTQEDSPFTKPDETVIPTNEGRTTEGLTDTFTSLDTTKEEGEVSLRAPPPPELEVINEVLNILIEQDKAKEASKEHKGFTSTETLTSNQTQSPLALTLGSHAGTKDLKTTIQDSMDIPIVIEPTRTTPYINRNLSEFASLYNHGPPLRGLSLLKLYYSQYSSLVLLEAPSKYSTDTVYPALLNTHTNKPLPSNTPQPYVSSRGHEVAVAISSIFSDEIASSPSAPRNDAFFHFSQPQQGGKS